MPAIDTRSTVGYAVMECPEKTIPGRGYHGIGLGPLEMFEEEMQNPLDFLRLPTNRWLHQEYSPPLIFRSNEMHTRLTSLNSEVGKMLRSMHEHPDKFLTSLAPNA